jgi:hypothetical protein
MERESVYVSIVVVALSAPVIFQNHAKVVEVRVACGLDLLQSTFTTIRPKSNRF